MAQLLHVCISVGCSFPSNPYSDVSDNIQILLLGEPAGFPGRKMSGFIQGFSRQTVWWPEPYWLKPVLSAPLMSAHTLKLELCCPCYLDLDFLLWKFIQSRLQDSPLISGCFLCASYVRRVIRITEKNKGLSHTLNVPAAEWTSSAMNSVAGKGGNFWRHLVP